MTPQEKRTALMAAGWRQDCQWTPPGQPRKPERWCQPGNWDEKFTLGAAYKLAVGVA